MPKGVYQHKLGFHPTKETKLKISNSLIGKTLGCKRTKETKLKISRALIGNTYTLGCKLSEATRRKMSESRKGSKSHFWKGGITPENKKTRRGIETLLWREAVFARDNWTCQKTGVKGDRTNAHHIQNFAQFPELRFAIDNGITLSEKSHMEFHKIYGRKNNTREQLVEFLYDKK